MSMIHIRSHGVIPPVSEGGEYVVHSVFEYGHGLLPDGVELVIDDDPLSMEASEGEPETGINYTLSVPLDEGSHSYFFRITIDGEEMESGTSTIRVSAPADDDDSSTDGDSDDGSSYIWLLILLAVVIGASLMLYIWLGRRKAPVNEGEDEEDWGDRDEENDEDRGLRLR